MKIIIGGRILGQLTDLSISGDAGLADVSVLSEGHKRWIRTKNDYSGSMDVRVEDPALLGLVLGDLQVDPTYTEKPLNISFNGINITQEYIQGSKAGTITTATTEKVAQRFRAGGEQLSTASIYVNSGGDASVTCTVEADSTGEPSGTPLDTDTIDCSGTGWVSADLSIATLVKDDWYWVVWSIPTTSTGLARSATSIYDEWGYKFYSGTWGTLETNDVSFKLLFIDDSSYLHIELTDGVTVHTIEGNLNTGKYTLGITSDEPLTASIDFQSDELTFSEVV